MIDFPEIPKVLKDGLYHYDRNWLRIESDNDYKMEIMKCMAYCKPDMYFTRLYRFLIKFDYEDQAKSTPSIEILE